MDLIIRNSRDLKDEIFRLESLKQLQSESLKQRFSSPKSAFSTVLSIFPNYRPNYIGLASRVVLPFVLNKTIFRHSNFLIRILVDLASQKAANYINEESIDTILKKLNAFIYNKKPHEKINPIAATYPVHRRGNQLQQHTKNG